MAVHAGVLVWLTLLPHHAAVPANPERCTDIEGAEPVKNEAALLQASASKIRATLPDDTADAADSKAQAKAPRLPAALLQNDSNVTEQAAERQSTAQARDEPAVAQPRPLEHRGRERLVLAGGNASVYNNSQAVAAIPQAPEPSVIEVLALSAANVSTPGGQDVTEAASLIFAGSSLANAVHVLAHRLRNELPDSVLYVFPSMQTDFGAVFGLAIMSSVIWCTLVTMAACVYRSKKSFPQAVSSRSKQDFEDWTSGPFDVHSDLSVCCWSCWCPCIRWADNMDMLGIVSFWVGLLVVCCLIMLTTVPGGLFLWLVSTLLWMSFRQQLRLKFDMEQSTIRTFLGDCALYCCCWPCAIAQEARHIEEACRAAHPAVRKFGV